MWKMRKNKSQNGSEATLFNAGQKLSKKVLRYEKP